MIKYNHFLSVLVLAIVRYLLNTKLTHTTTASTEAQKDHLKLEWMFLDDSTAHLPFLA